MVQGPLEELRLIRRGETYNLERLDTQGTFSAIRLSEANILALMPLIHQAYVQLLESQSTPDLKAAGGVVSVTYPIEDFAAGPDFYHTKGVLGLAGRCFEPQFVVSAAQLGGRVAPPPVVGDEDR